MPSTNDNPKLRWWQFSLRKFILLTTFLTVVAVAFWRYREWGRELCIMRDKLVMPTEADPYLYRSIPQFEREYWLPMKVYEWTSRKVDGTLDPAQIEVQGHYSGHRPTREIGSNN